MSAGLLWDGPTVGQRHPILDLISGRLRRRLAAGLVDRHGAFDLLGSDARRVRQTE
jgi:hypothetical protein